MDRIQLSQNRDQNCSKFDDNISDSKKRREYQKCVCATSSERASPKH